MAEIPSASGLPSSGVMARVFVIGIILFLLVLPLLDRIGSSLDFLGLSPSGGRRAPAAAPKPAVETRHTSAKRSGTPGFTEHQIPAGQVIPVRTRTAIRSDTNRPGDAVEVVVTDAITQDDIELIPTGSTLLGSVFDAHPATSADRTGRLVLAFSVIQHATTGSRAAITTTPTTIEAAAAPGKRPIDIDIRRGHGLYVVLSKPLWVHIPVEQKPPRPKRPPRPSAKQSLAGNF